MGDKNKPKPTGVWPTVKPFVNGGASGLFRQATYTTARLGSFKFELNFAINVLGTYTMTESMLPLVQKAAPDACVIRVSSVGMYNVPLTEDLMYSQSNFNGVEQYARNKRVQVALTEYWAERYKNNGIGFYSMHPGWAETLGTTKSLPSFSQKMPIIMYMAYGNVDCLISITEYGQKYDKENPNIH